jgi:hypothetical protein
VQLTIVFFHGRRDLKGTKWQIYSLPRRRVDGCMPLIRSVLGLQFTHGNKAEKDKADSHRSFLQSHRFLLDAYLFENFNPALLLHIGRAQPYDQRRSEWITGNPKVTFLLYLKSLGIGMLGAAAVWALRFTGNSFPGIRTIASDQHGNIRA